MRVRFQKIIDVEDTLLRKYKLYLRNVRYPCRANSIFEAPPIDDRVPSIDASFSFP